VRVGTGLPLRNVKRMTRLLCDKIETIDPGFGIEAGSAPTRHTRLDHGPGSRALPQGRGRGGETRFPRTRLDGEPLLPDPNACLTPVDGQAERTAALAMIEPLADRPTGVTLGADKGYDARIFVNKLRAMNVRPHVAQNTNGRRSAIDGLTTRHAGYAISQRIRKRIEEAFCWMKSFAGQRKTRFGGVERVGWSFTFAAAAYNLVRLPKLLAA
jgi:hypothetical protein